MELNTSGRLFTFGCSFTNYWKWPTWADITATNFKQWENWGICGGGNSQVLYNLLECHQRNQIGPTDTVMVMWTNISRQDQYIDRRWTEFGNIYWSDHYPKDYVKRFACERGFLIRDLAVISAVRQCLKAWGCQYRFLSLVPLADVSMGFNQERPAIRTKDAIKLYEDVIEEISPSIFETVYSGNWNRRPGIPAHVTDNDIHATPIEHLKYLEAVMPEAITDRARSWINTLQGQVESGVTLSWAGTRAPAERL